MVKIIISSPTYTAICPECGIDFMYQKEDIVKNYLYISKSTVVCPNCGNVMTHIYW